jgi:hypothetical protein
MAAMAAVAAIRAAFGSGGAAVKVHASRPTLSGAKKYFYVINKVLFCHGKSIIVIWGNVLRMVEVVEGLRALRG